MKGAGWFMKESFLAKLSPGDMQMAVLMTIHTNTMLQGRELLGRINGSAKIQFQKLSKLLISDRSIEYRKIKG